MDIKSLANGFFNFLVIPLFRLEYDLVLGGIVLKQQRNFEELKTEKPS